MSRDSRNIRVLIVDDSMVFRELLARGLSTAPNIEVVGTAKDPYEARELIVRLQPDVLTCDVEMPRMNGVEFVRKLLPQYAVPVIVVSTISSAIFDALDAGAVDFVVKPNMGKVDEVKRFILDMIHKVTLAVRSNVSIDKDQVRRDVSRTIGTYGLDDHLIVIGASTGGIEAISKLINMLPNQLPGIAIVQHIPPPFSKMFAERLNANTSFRVKEARTGDVLERGTVLIAPGDQHISVVPSGGRFTVYCTSGEKVSGHRPSVDVLFKSAAKHAGPRTIGVLLTGMGYDGAAGLLSIRRRGGSTIGQDSATSVIYGMPKAAFEVGAVEYQLPLDQIAAKICSLLGRRG